MPKAWISVTVKADSYSLKKRLHRIRLFVWVTAFAARLLKVSADVDLHEPVIEDLITVEESKDKPIDSNRSATQLGPAPERNLKTWFR